MRPSIKSEIADELLFRNDHTCCICRESRKQVQIHHLNGDTSDNTFKNLVILCLDCHGRVTGTEGLGRRFTGGEIKKYKEEWESRIGRKNLNLGLKHSKSSNTYKSLKPYYCKASQKRRYCKNCLKVFNDIESFLINDQLSETGAWGKSLSILFDYVIGRKPTEHEIKEGGIVSTFLVVRALATKSGTDAFNESPISKAIIEYLLKRKSSNGGFGRFITSRSGQEIHPNLRHTALAVNLLANLNGPPDSIIEGLKYLNKNELLCLKDDAAPSIAASSILLAFEMIVLGEWGKKHLSNQDKKDLGLSQWEDKRIILIRSIEDESSSPLNPYNPIWKPYGNLPKELIYTALVTIDLLTTLGSIAPWETILRALNHILTKRLDSGLPFDCSQKTIDIGMTVYFCAICSRPDVFTRLSQTNSGKRIIEASNVFFEFIMNNYCNEKFTKLTKCDTIANILLMNGCPWHSILFNSKISE